MLCKIGDVEVWRILEIHGPFVDPKELYPTAGPNVGTIIEGLAPGSICQQSGRLILPVQGFLLKTPSHTILVDSCVGNDKTVPGTPDWHKRSDNRFETSLTAAGVGFDDIDYVLCTHLHTDHVGWNTRLLDGRWVPTFPNARYIMPAADEEFQAGHMLGDHVTLIPTPGHTPGHVSVKITSGDSEAIITGDAIHSTAQCQHPEWHFKYDADPERAVSSRVDLLEKASESDCTVLGSHFSLPSIGRVKAVAGKFQWEE